MRIIKLATIVIMAAGILTCSHSIWAETTNAISSNTEQTSQASIEELAENLIHSMSNGDCQEIVKHFDENMKKAAPPQGLKQIWKQFLAQFGAFEKITGTKLTESGGMQIALVTCNFSKTAVDIMVPFNTSNEIAGIRIAATRPRE